MIVFGSDVMSRDSFQPLSAPINGAALCLACGLCCVGVVHTHVPLGADEMELARELDLRVDAFEEGVGFHLPCPCYRDGKCSAYYRRPRACVNYQCELLQRYLQGEVSLAESLSLVAQAKTMLDTLRAEMPNGSATPITLKVLRQVVDERQRHLERDGDAALE